MQLATVAFNKIGIGPPRGLPLKILALVGSLASNSIFYGLVGLGRPRTAWLRGAALGLAMGVGALALRLRLERVKAQRRVPPQRRRELLHGTLWAASSQHSHSLLPTRTPRLVTEADYVAKPSWHS